MKSPAVRTQRKKPHILTERDEKILRTIYAYRYMSVLDVAWLLFQPSSKTHVGEIMSDLAGGVDLKSHSYLCRFGLPSVGRPTFVYSLGSKGRSFLADRGLPVNWYFRPYKLGQFSVRYVQHNLTLTRFLVALNVWIRKQSDFSLREIRFGHELSGDPGKVRLAGRGEPKTVPVIPDAWLVIERVRNRKQIPIFLEIDRGMEFQKRFKEHIRSRIKFIEDGGYSRMFGTEAVTIAYATTGQIPEYRERRRQTMCLWTREVLEELDLIAWARIFRFASLVDKGYDFGVFEKPVWYLPDSPTPVSLVMP